MTNASLIDESMVEKLKDISPLFQITFDGTKNDMILSELGKRQQGNL